MTKSGEINGFRHLPGKNCLTTAVRNILNHYGYRFQEPMIFGLAEGLGFQFEQLAAHENPWVGGTGRRMLQSFCANLDLTYDLMAFETGEEAEADLFRHIDEQIPVIIHVDLYHLPYFGSEMHFAGHRVVPVAYDADNVYLADTGFQEIKPCPREALNTARSSSYPPYNPHRRRIRLERPEQKPFVEENVAKALFNLLAKFQYNMPGYNLNRIHDLKEHLGDYKSLRALFIQIEKAGTGGGLSRKLFAEFLDQSFQIYSRGIYESAAELFGESGRLWTRIAVDARNGSTAQTADLLDQIYKLETEGLTTLSLFEADDL